MKTKPATISAPARFEIVDEQTLEKKKLIKVPRSSLERLIYNSENITHVLTSTKELRKLRFDELSLLRDIRELVETNPDKFASIEDPGEFRREIRATVLPQYVTGDFIRITQEKLLNELVRTTRNRDDQDSLMTALVFLQSHTDLDLPLEDNPLWEIIFNLSIKDGLKFVDFLTVLTEGIDSLKMENPEALTRDPLILQKTKQICQWPIFWRIIIEQKEILPFEELISSILRGNIMIELYFDELVHLPYYLFQLFRSEIERADFLSEQIPDGDKEKAARQLYDAILKCVERDATFLIPNLLQRIKKIQRRTRNTDEKEQLKLAISTLTSNDLNANNIFLITLIAAKISMRKYWENRRDRFFFFTILKNPLDPKNYYDYGQILLRQKEMKTAEQLFKCAVEIDPAGFWGYWGMGSYSYRTSQYFESEGYLQQALRITQQEEIKESSKYRRELFLIKDDLKRLRQSRVKLQIVNNPQIDMFPHRPSE
ncbi:MAG: tetratricopeptide repeat protein [Candidatus Zhuqueibacterota bacterium]